MGAAPCPVLGARTDSDGAAGPPAGPAGHLRRRCPGGAGHLVDGRGAGAGVAGQPGGQLRLGRPGHRAGHPRGAVGRPVGVELLGVRRCRPGDGVGVGRGRGGPGGAPLLRGAAGVADRRNHRPGAAAGLRRADPAPGVGRQPVGAVAPRAVRGVGGDRRGDLRRFRHRGRGGGAPDAGGAGAGPEPHQRGRGGARLRPTAASGPSPWASR